MFKKPMKIQILELQEGKKFKGLCFIMLKLNIIEKNCFKQINFFYFSLNFKKINTF